MNKDQQAIEAYLGQTMTSEERLAFEQRLSQEPKLSEAYEHEVVAREVIKEAGRLALKDTLEALDNGIPNEPIQKKVIPLWAKRAMRVAAVFILFAGIYQVFFNFSGVSTSEVYDTYFEVYEAPSLVRDVNESPNWKLVIDAYRDAAYKKALPLLENAKGEVPDYLIAFYTGISQMAAQKPDWKQAIQNFEVVLATDNDYHQQAEWYKALALLKLDQEEQAEVIFKKIVATKSYQHKQAAAILKLNIK